jgi:methionyl-tRNA formyltransferase
MQMEAGLDTGPVLHSGRLPIAAIDTAGTLHDKLADLGARLIVDALGKLPSPPCPQPEAGVTYAAKIAKSEAPLDWRLSADQLARQVRAFDPSPGATAILQGTMMKVWNAETQAGHAAPGMIISVDRRGIVVACGEGLLRLTELQRSGGKRLPVGQFLAGNPVEAGTVFALPAA